MGPNTVSAPRFYPALDGIRAVAVTMVLIIHYLPGVFPFAWLGVQPFFVLSGFLITGILFESIDDPHRFRNFYARRALRIFPLYYALLALWTAIALLTHGPIYGYYALCLVYLQNFLLLLTHGQIPEILVTGSGLRFGALGPLWTLAIEEQFYLIWPVLVFAVRDRRRLMQLCVALIVFRLGIAAYWQTHLSPATLQLGLICHMLPTQCDGFLMGGLVALWLRGDPSRRIQAKAGVMAACGLLFYAALLFLLHKQPGIIGGQNVFDYTSGFQGTIGLPLANLVSALILIAVVQKGSVAFRLMNPRALRSVGRISYGIYLLHPMVLWLTEGAWRRVYRLFHATRFFGTTHAIAAAGLTLVIAYASFYGFERPFLKLKDRFSPSPSHTVTSHPL